ncbi:MAG TPA: dihydroneopterin aldolase [Gemmatimonadaceae bacterium]|nr:dihydroneopterin aldolase [Gemmatimonadaceae bacterium]
MTTRLAIALNGMRFHTLVGVLPHERVHAQPLEVDLVVWVAPGATDLVDYRVLYDRVAQTVDAGPHGFLEDLADALATGTLAVESVARVRVTVRKPHVVLPGPVRSAEVMLERSRGE